MRPVTSLTVILLILNRIQVIYPQIFMFAGGSPRQPAAEVYTLGMNLFGLGTPELLLIVFLLLMFFGKDRLPDMARSIGKSFRELKEGITSGAASDEKKETKSSK